MAGIYLHIPFCKTRCAYCDFYSTTGSEWQERYVAALCQELRQRKDYLRGEPVQTVYLGGGTPSQIRHAGFERIFNTLEDVFGLSQCLEITLEANPDDLTTRYVQMLRSLPVNRISMGIQTFHNDTLRLLNRRHTATEAVQAFSRCRDLGFQNISIDLIYGLPGESEEMLCDDLRQAIGLQPEHISAYHLSYEEGTPLHRMLQAGKVKAVSEEQSVRYFSVVADVLRQAGYEHYEISNFCKPGYHSRHNSGYWDGTPYLGVGAAAHSYDGSSREWNVADVRSYVEGMEQGQRDYEVEQLTATNRYNEYIYVRLRTREGICLDDLRRSFGDALLHDTLQTAQKWIESHQLSNDGTHLRLTPSGIVLSDSIVRDFVQV